MGSTVAVALLKSGRLYLAHAGDSRAYLLRDGRIVQLTLDHSVAEELARAGAISKAQARRHPMRHNLTRHMGQSDLVPSLSDLELKKGDLLLLATDGLYGEVDDLKIEQVMTSASSVKECCETLVQEALDQGARDNVTVVVVDCTDGNNT